MAPKVTKQTTKPKRITKKQTSKPIELQKLAEEIEFDPVDLGETPEQFKKVIPDEVKEEVKELVNDGVIVPIPKEEVKEKETSKTEEVKEEIKEEVKNELKPVEESVESKNEVSDDVNKTTEEKLTTTKKPKKSKNNRRLVNKKQTTNEKGEKCYEYTYELLDDEGKVISKQVVTNNQKKNTTIKYDENNNEQIQSIITSVNKFIETNGIKLPDLYKRMNLDSHLKGMIEIITTELNMKITQKQLRELINKHVLGKNKENNQNK